MAYQEEFIQRLLPFASKAAERLGISPELLIAQAAQETGWGKDVKNNNYFNIKGEGGAKMNALEYDDNGQPYHEPSSFRGYADAGESFDDYVNFLESNPRYAQTLKSNTDAEFTQGLQDAGYATDPDYANNLNAVKESVSKRMPETATPFLPSVENTQGDTNMNNSNWWDTGLGRLKDSINNDFGGAADKFLNWRQGNQDVAAIQKQLGYDAYRDGDWNSFAAKNGLSPDGTPVAEVVNTPTTAPTLSIDGNSGQGVGPLLSHGDNYQASTPVQQSGFSQELAPLTTDPLNGFGLSNVDGLGINSGNSMSWGPSFEHNRGLDGSALATPETSWFDGLGGSMQGGLDWLGQNKDGINAGMGLAQTGMGLWGGFNQLGMAQDMFDEQKKNNAINLDRAKTSYNNVAGGRNAMREGQGGSYRETLLS